MLFNRSQIDNLRHMANEGDDELNKFINKLLNDDILNDKTHLKNDIIELRASADEVPNRKWDETDIKILKAMYAIGMDISAIAIYMSRSESDIFEGLSKIS